MKYIDSKEKEHEVSEMGIHHLANAIKKHGEEIGRFNPELLIEMKAELERREDKPVPKEDLPKVKNLPHDDHDYHQDDFESDFEVDDEF